MHPNPIWRLRAAELTAFNLAIPRHLLPPPCMDVPIFHSHVSTPRAQAAPMRRLVRFHSSVVAGSGGDHSVNALAASTKAVGEPERIAETTARSTSTALWGTVIWMVTEPELAWRSRYLRVCSRLLSRRASMRLRISAAVRVLDLAMMESFMWC